MSKQQRILLVEGRDDREFLQTFLCNLDLAVDIEPETPKNFCATESDGVDVVRTRALPFAYERIKRGEITHLGIIVDADSATYKYGFNVRRKQFTTVLKEYGYEIPPFSGNPEQGELFTHPEEYAAIGLWIMPTHHQDGMLEDLLLGNLSKPHQSNLLEKVDEVIEHLDNLRYFKNKNLSKARLATLLAWQKKPGMATDKAYKAKVFDVNATAFSKLAEWLKTVFC